MYICVYICICMCLYVNTYNCMYVYMHVCMHVYMCVYVCVYMCVFVYIYIYIYIYYTGDHMSVCNRIYAIFDVTITLVFYVTFPIIFCIIWFSIIIKIVLYYYLSVACFSVFSDLFEIHTYLKENFNLRWTAKKIILLSFCQRINWS